MGSFCVLYLELCAPPNKLLLKVKLLIGVSNLCAIRRVAEAGVSGDYLARF